jgi:diguanylate cyclase
MPTVEREQGYARTALALMTECEVPATPENFELFYAYASGEAQALVQVMGAHIAARKPFTPEMLLDLRLRCLSSARNARAMDNFGADVGDVINSVLTKLESAGRQTIAYQDTLSAASGALGGAAPGDLRLLVNSLITATREMEQRTKSLESELQQSSEQVRDLRTALDDVRKESLTDPLTGIANRKAFDDAMRAVMAQGGGEREAATLLLCDIDHFKKFNDSFGHQTGDQVLRLVANCLAENVKGRDTAARYGGEEFAVLLRGTGLADATRVAEQIRQTVESKKLVKKSTGEVLGSITISIGVAEFAANEAGEAVIRRADACLYGAKSHGRNLVVNQNDPRIASLESSAA